MTPRRGSQSNRSLTQIQDAAITIGYRLLREQCGPAWQPMQVQFSHGRPERIAPYRRLCGADLTCNAEVSALLFASSWLPQPIAGADARTHGVLDRAIRAATAKVPMTFTGQVRGVLPHSPRESALSALTVRACRAARCAHG